MGKHADDRVDVVEARLAGIMRLAPDEPQMATRLITTVANNALTYYVRVTPLDPIRTQVQRADKAILSAIMEVVTPDQAVLPVASQDRLNRAEVHMRLPISHSGMGLTALESRADAAFIGGLLASQADPAVAINVHALHGPASDAHAGVLAQLGLDKVQPGHHLSSVISPTCSGLVDGEFALRFNSNPSRRQATSAIMKSVASRSRRRLRIVVGEHAQGRPGETPTATLLDVNHVRAVTSKSQASRVFQSDLSDSKNRIPPRPYVFGFRSHFNLPLPVSFTEDLRPGDAEIPARLCPRRHSYERADGKEHTQDHTGAHAASCSSTYASRCRMHSELIRVVRDKAREIGLTADPEPSTAAILNDHYSSEECSALFPKSSKAAIGNRHLLVEGALQELKRTTSPADRARIIRRLTAITDEGIRTSKDAKGLRVDLHIRSPEVGVADLLIDVGTTHHNCATTLAASLKHHQTITDTENALHRISAAALPNTDPTPPVVARVKTKKRVYGPLMSLLEAQLHQRRRDRPATFLAPIISIAGEFAPDAFALAMETLAKKCGKIYRSIMRPRDGHTPASATALFRRSFKDNLATTVFKGNGNMLRDCAAAGPAA